MAQSSRRRAGAHESAQPSDFPSNRSTIERQQSPRHLPGSSVSSFQHARIEGDVSSNRVYTAGRDLIVNDNDLVTMILLPHVASGAIFDCAERYSAGRCHRGTRQRIIARVKNWIQGTSPDSKGILWMYGAAGAGKSSIMQSICEFLRDSGSETNRASFFFARGHTDRGKSTKLFVTLAYQLAMQFPSLRAEINDALHRDSTLPTKSMDIQLRSLIIDPLRRCEAMLSRTPILFIDGLDECDAEDNQGVDAQSRIITLISHSLVAENIPARFMIASRPEYWIRDSFETSPLLDITLPLSLRDDIDADRDIRMYLTENFEQIRLKKSRIMGSVELPWPPIRIINLFVHDASGQYIYASTILKFVGDHPFKSPEEQLRILITPGPHRATAYSELDRLYATIVSAFPEWETMKRVLGGLLIDVNLIVIRVILEVPQTEINLVLDALRSLIDVTPPEPLSKDDQLLIPIFGQFKDETLLFCHLSFREFLLDKARSGLYHIDVEAVRRKVVCDFVGIIQHNLDENYASEPHISRNVSILEYRRMMDVIILEVNSHFYTIQDLFPLLHRMIETLRCFDPGRSMNHPACFMRDMNLLSAFLEYLDPKYKFNWNPIYPVNPGFQDSFTAIVSRLQNLASMARKIGICVLSLYNGFSVTHTLFLLQYLHPSTSWKVKIRDFLELLTISNSTINDNLSGILKHCHITDLGYYRIKNSSIEEEKHLYMSQMSVVNLGEPSVRAELGLHGAVVDLEQRIVEGRLCRSEWKNQDVSLACKLLRSIINNHSDGLEHLYIGHYNQDIFNLRGSLLLAFFNHGGISDIREEDYFTDKYCLSFVELMVNSDLKAWLALFPSSPYVWDNLNMVLVPILCWFNRQLTNPKTAKLVEDHDASLLSKMAMAMNTIFQRCFVPSFTTPYFSRLVVRLGSKSIEIKVSPSSYSEETIDHCPLEHISTQAFRKIHDEIFGNGPHAGRDQPVIPRSEWYPPLAAYLLNICVKYLRRRSPTKSAFRGDNHDHEFFEIFPCIVQCLPYAQTTRQNLDALRAIKYLSRQVDVQSQILWAPSGFRSGARAFLKGYEPYSLSSEELDDFELWMRSITEVPPEDWDDVRNNDAYAVA